MRYPRSHNLQMADLGLKFGVLTPTPNSLFPRDIPKQAQVANALISPKQHLAPTPRATC